MTDELKIDARDRVIRTEVLPHNIAVKLDRVNIGYKVDGVYKPTVKDISFTAGANQITALMGPNGCGKTTILGAINGFHSMKNSTAEVDGSVLVQFCDNNNYRVEREIVSVTKGMSQNEQVRLRSRVGYMQQKFAVFPGKSIIDNVAYGLELRGVNKKLRYEAALFWLNQVGLFEEVKGRLKDPASKLSGGQRQRLCLARTFCVDPEIILMDEPTASLDPKSTEVVLDLIRELSQDKTIILIAHNMRIIRDYTDKTVFISAKGHLREDGVEETWGKVVEQGTTYDIFYRAQERETSQYLAGRIG